jgi:hypothetical protein
MWLGGRAFHMKFQNGLTNDIEWWLIEMHSKYPETFNTGAWEGSCTDLAIDKLYAERGIRIGKYQEWDAAQEAARPPKKRSKAPILVLQRGRRK